MGRGPSTLGVHYTNRTLKKIIILKNKKKDKINMSTKIKNK